MSEISGFFKQRLRALRCELENGLRAMRRKGPSQIQFWLIALIIGIVAGFVAIGFRVGIDFLQENIYGASDKALHTRLAELHWAWVLSVPIIGGLVVGLLLQYFTTDGRIQSLANVIEGAAIRDGRVDKRQGLLASLIALITLSTGGSTGREGPVVHFGAVVSSWVSNLIRADGITARDLMGCAAAAAVSASFNAPIAGTIFALEVVLRHFAVHAFAPIVIASVAGTVVSRWQMGNVTEFILPASNLSFYQELPAFLMLGLLCGIVAYVMIRALFVAEDLGDALQKATKMPIWVRPVLAGALLGAMAIWFPHIIGVGYETTSLALTGKIGFWLAMAYVVVKVAAVAITFAGRMGGGVFSPSLMVGALTGLSFGYVATAIAPGISGTETLYALAGMGAVAAAVLGAPISTTLIVFELTGDWQAGIAVMVSVSLASALTSRLVDKSFFLTLLERRGVHLADGPQAYLLATISAGRLMRNYGDDNAASETACQALIDQGVFLTTDASLEQAMPLFDAVKSEFIPVVETADEQQVMIGALFHIDALKAYNRALAECAREEHS